MTRLIEELEQVYTGRQYLTASYRQLLEEPALEELPRQADYAQSPRLQQLMARVLLGRVAYGERAQVAERLAGFAQLPLYAQEEELQRLHAEALSIASLREVDLYRENKTSLDEALQSARKISAMPGFASQESLKVSQAAALSACAQAAAARSRQRGPDQYELLGQAERICEEITMIPGFTASARIQFEYALAVLELLLAWRNATPGRQNLQNIQKARALAGKVRALSQLNQPGGEDMLTRWVPELARIEPDFPASLPEHPAFATSGALQNHFSTYVSSRSARPETTPAEALELARRIPQLPLYANWPSMAQCYCLALGSVLGKAGKDDLAVAEEATRLLEKATPNPAPALRGWDALLALEPDNVGFQAGRRAWLEQHGFGPEATVAEVMRKLLRGG